MSTTSAGIAGPGLCPSPRSSNEEALQITGRSYVSYSQLSLMRTCPRKFSFQYVERAPKDFLSGSLLYGSSIHAALESYYRARLEGLTLSASEMMLVYQGAWQRSVAEAGSDVPVKLGAREDLASVQALASRSIDAFLASPLANPTGHLLGVEEEFRVILHPDLPDLVGRVDLVTSCATALHVTDFKTSRGCWTPEKALEAGDQLVLYASATSHLACEMHLPVKLAFAVLTKTKAPQVQVLPVPADTRRLAAMTTSAVQVWSAIRHGQFYPNPGPLACSTCPYKSRCPALRGG